MLDHTPPSCFALHGVIILRDEVLGGSLLALQHKDAVRETLNRLLVSWLQHAASEGIQPRHDAVTAARQDVPSKGSERVNVVAVLAELVPE